MSEAFFNIVGDPFGDRLAPLDSSARNRRFVRKTMPRLKSIAETYATKCRGLQIRVHVSGGDEDIVFRLSYRTGGDQTLTLAADRAMENRLAFEKHYPAQGGHRLKSLPATWYDEDSWSDKVLETMLQQTVNDFLFQAKRRGGL